MIANRWRGKLLLARRVSAKRVTNAFAFQSCRSLARRKSAIGRSGRAPLPEALTLLGRVRVADCPIFLWLAIVLMADKIASLPAYPEVVRAEGEGSGSVAL
jgi:hypothetical protein